MISIRARTLLLLLSLLCVALSMISLVSYHDAKHEVEELFDAQMAQTGRLLEGIVGADMPQQARTALQSALDQALKSHNSEQADPLATGHPYEGKLAFQLFDDHGRTLLQSASAPTDALAQLLIILHRDKSLKHEHVDGEPLSSFGRALVGYHNVSLAQHNWRLFVLHDNKDNHWIMIAEREDVRGELVGKIALKALFADIIGLPLLALLVWLAIGWGLAPLKAMAERIRARAPDDLDPLLFRPLPTELEPMAAALNRLLLQVKQLISQEKRFIADAAHELRTPLAVLRIHAQNAQTAEDPLDRNKALKQLNSGVERATRVVAQLLTLARLDPHSVQLKMVEIDLLGYVRNELAELIPLAFDKQQELLLEANPADDFRITADSPSLGTLLQNLVSNAVQYTPLGGSIEVHIDAQTDALLLRVLDSGEGVDPQLREKLFERFYRGSTGEGAGLGLSIVQRVVELHRGSIRLDTSPMGGLEVIVRLPRNTRTRAQNSAPSVS